MKENPFNDEEKNKFLIEVPTYGKTMNNEGVEDAIAEEGKNENPANDGKEMISDNKE